jgi:anaerobic magnesium-protoporphyrin IX monomethyl ester cyclase
MHFSLGLTEPRSPEEVLGVLDARWEGRWCSSLARDQHVLLLGCPTTDITQPYHSLSYLAGSLGAASIPYAVRDLNIEFWHYVASPPVIEELRQECLTRGSKESGDVRAVLYGYAALLENRQQYRDAWRVLRQRTTFFDLSHYLPAVHRLSDLPRLLTLLSDDCVYRSFSSMSPPGSEVDNINLVKLRTAASRGVGIPVVDAFHKHHANKIAEQSPCFVGFTVPFLSQLYHSAILSNLLKRRGCHTVVGGPIAAKFYKYATTPSALEALSFAFDLLITGEGDSLVRDLPTLFANRVPLQPALTNTVDLRSPRPITGLHFENVNDLPAPEYGIWDYDLYASPEPGALYSPTRGCYWNKCSFCDYGLAMNGPTSPWRVREPRKVVSDLRAASAHAKFFFFSVDVLSPAYARRLSEALIESDVKLTWMADFRLEKSLDESSIEIFRASGCKGAAFGMESASQRVLAQMQKGTVSGEVPRIVADFKRAGIPVQLMGFVGFPTETACEARETLKAARELSRDAATVAIGRFGLTPGSDVAAKPEAYRVVVNYQNNGHPAIPWELQWKHIDDSPRAGDVVTDHELLDLVRGFPFPFLGATTTLHSLLHFSHCSNGNRRVPRWSAFGLDQEDLVVIPAYVVLGEGKSGAALVQSALTGRIIDTHGDFVKLLNSYFGRGWVRWRGQEVGSSEVARCLTEHSLALFMPWSELTDAEQAACSCTSARE